MQSNLKDTDNVTQSVHTTKISILSTKPYNLYTFRFYKSLLILLKNKIPSIGIIYLQAFINILQDWNIIEACKILAIHISKTHIFTNPVSLTRVVRQNFIFISSPYSFLYSRLQPNHFFSYIWSKNMLEFSFKFTIWWLPTGCVPMNRSSIICNI